MDIGIRKIEQDFSSTGYSIAPSIRIFSIAGC